MVLFYGSIFPTFVYYVVHPNKIDLISNFFSILVIKCGWNELEFSYTYKNINSETPLEI